MGRVERRDSVASSQSDDDEEEEKCPLCCEELDVTDRNFFPCPCGYQICLYCWNHIKDQLNGLCPACRTPYSDKPQISPVDREEILKKRKEKKRREKQERKEREKEREQAERAREREHRDRERDRRDLDTKRGGAGGGTPAAFDRSTLRNVRVVQRNLVYVIGLPPAIALEETLKRPEYFGQYGRIVKIAVNRTLITPSLEPKPGQPPLPPSCSAYVTFQHKEDARACIQALDNCGLEGRYTIRASFGTTKYCNTFLRYVPCTTPDCLFLHDVHEDEGWTKEEIQSWQAKLPGTTPNSTIVVGHGGPSGTGRRASQPIFPPPRFDQPIAPPTMARTASGGVAAKAANPWQQPPLPPQQPPPVVGPSVLGGANNPLPTPAQAVALMTSPKLKQGERKAARKAKAAAAAAATQQKGSSPKPKGSPPGIVPPPGIPVPASPAAAGKGNAGGGKAAGAGAALPLPPPAMDPSSPPLGVGPGGGLLPPSSLVGPPSLALIDGPGGLLGTGSGGGAAGGQWAAVNGGYPLASSDPATDFPPIAPPPLGGIGEMPVPASRGEGARAPPPPIGGGGSSKNLSSLGGVGGGIGASGGGGGGGGLGGASGPGGRGGKGGGENILLDMGVGMRNSRLFAPPPLWAVEQQMPGMGGLAPPNPFGPTGLDQQQQAANPGAAEGAANGFHHSLFPFQLPTGEAAQGDPAHPPHVGYVGSGGKPPGTAGGGNNGSNDPFNSTESLARMLGLSLPETPDSLAAQARAHGGGGQHLRPPAPGAGVAASRYAFATDGDSVGGGGVHGGEGGLLGASPAAPSAAAQGGQGGHHQKRGSGGGNGAQGNGRHHHHHHHHRPSASGGLDSSLQSSMALLQQLLPNCNLTYGDGLKEELAPGYAGAGVGGGGMGKEKGGGGGGRQRSPGGLL